MAPRSRTGCLTCRQRKLKCSEERPVCAQCLKANRECAPSSGITFRHQQNPSMNGTAASRESLKSFYGYKETFGKGTVWVDVPQNLTFVHTNNPYDDEDANVDDNGVMLDESGQSFSGRGGSTTTQTQQAFGGIGQGTAYSTFTDYATHGLEALSAVASQDQYNYAPPPPPMGQGDLQQTLPTQEPAAASPASPQSQAAQPVTQGIDFLLNPSSAKRSRRNSNIDPRLHLPADITAADSPQQQPLSPHDQPADGAAFTNPTPPSQDVTLATAIQ